MLFVELVAVTSVLLKVSTMINNSSSYSETLDRKCLKTLIERGSKARFGRGWRGGVKLAPYFLFGWSLT